MNWKLILLLSIFGLFMAIATVFFIPTKIEPAFWLVIFIVCAILIAKYGNGRFFLHGFLVSMANCVWITGFHILFIHQYMSVHPEMAQMNASMPLAGHPRLMMLITGPVFGVVSGLILGLFSYIASNIIKKNV